MFHIFIYVYIYIYIYIYIYRLDASAYILATLLGFTSSARILGVYLIYLMFLFSFLI